MHVIHRPHLPRVIGVTLVAAVLAIAISLVLASSLNSIDNSSSHSGVPAAHAAPTMAGVQQTIPRWTSSPFTNLLNRPLPQPFLIPQP